MKICQNLGWMNRRSIGDGAGGGAGWGGVGTGPPMTENIVVY